MAIFNSYVKLPEGMKHVCSSRIRGLFKLIERLFNAGISGQRQRFLGDGTEIKEYCNVNARSINPGWLMFMTYHYILIYIYIILYLWCSLIHLFCFVWNKSWGHHFGSSPKRSDWRRRLHAGKCHCGTGEAEWCATVDVSVLQPEKIWIN
jgi:hypothetical protein